MPAKSPAQSQPPLHPACEPLAALLGVWRGSGHGAYPTVEPFSYTEQVSFSHVGKPHLAYAQKTFDAQTGQPMHAEFGYWRPQSDGGLEVVLVHPTGATEVTQGSFAATGDPERPLEIELRSVAIGLTETAKEVVQLNRVFWLEAGGVTDAAAGDRLSYRLDMAAVGQPLQFHIEAQLERQPD